MDFFKPISSIVIKWSRNKSKANVLLVYWLLWTSFKSYFVVSKVHKTVHTFSGSPEILKAHSRIRDPELLTPLIWNKSEMRGQATIFKRHYYLYVKTHKLSYPNSSFGALFSKHIGFPFSFCFFFLLSNCLYVNSYLPTSIMPK